MKANSCPPSSPLVGLQRPETLTPGRWYAVGSLILGCVMGIILAFVLATHGGASNPSRNVPRTPRILPEAEGRITEVVMHVAPSFRGVVWDTYRDFWSAIGSDVRLHLVADESLNAAARRAVQAEITAVNPGLGEHLTWVSAKGPITTWSKDRALVSEPAEGMPAKLWVPAQPEKNWVQRRNDWGTVAALEGALGGRFQRVVANFDFDAGDFVVTGRHVIVGANLIAKNARRGIPNSDTLRRRLAAWLDHPVLVLGERPEDVPDHHLAMTMTPLDGNTVLVGDPRLAEALVGSEFLPGETSRDTGEPLRADFSAATARRFDRLAADLARAGYSVVRIPNVPLDAKTYITYTNGIFEVRRGERIAYLPTYGFGVLDDAARAVYERLGWDVRPIRVARVYPYHGTIGCLVNVLARGDQRPNGG